MSTALLLASICLAVLLLVNFHCWDRLLRHEQVVHRAQWEADGRPWSGYSFWTARGPVESGATGEPRPFDRRASRAAAVECLRRWLTHTPAWAQADSQALRWLRRWRCTCVGCVLLLIALLALLIVRELAGGAF